jgi:hypothetical protein
MFRNTYQKGARVPTFDAPVRVVNDAFCPQPVANGNLYDLTVRFGDLNGDGIVDVCTLHRPHSRFLTDISTSNNTSASTPMGAAQAGLIPPQVYKPYPRRTHIRQKPPKDPSARMFVSRMSMAMG